jgi:SNF2 family DNA or RNA helicase
MAAVKNRKRKIGIRDRLGQLTHRGVCRLLGEGEDGQARLRRGGRFEINLPRDVFLGGDMLRVNVPDPEMPNGQAVVNVVEMTNKPQGLLLNCEQCETRCDHMAAVLGLVLDDKLALGLSAPPDPNEPIENLTEDELVRRALADRQERADAEKMTLRSTNSDQPWTDYTVTSRLSGKTYRVSLRGFDPGESYCSCPDFQTNHLGTCKHILYAGDKVRKRFSKKRLAKTYRRRNLSLRLNYGQELGLQFNLPDELDDAAAKILGRLRHAPSETVKPVVDCVRKLESAGYPVHVYPDAEQFIQQRLLQRRLQLASEEIRSNPADHALRRELLDAELLPYQLDGIAFAVGAGRAILADDMGLGKTIQGIGVAELLAQLADIRRVLVVCPASLKSQWRGEIERFCGRSSQLVIGSAEERVAQYDSDAFFTICNYEQILRDHPTIERVGWDLIILDEGQRIKNWESKTSQLVKTLKSPFALVLSGTPLENRLEELYTVVGFIDDRRLGPAYRFFHKHRVVDDRGRVEGYRNLDQLRKTLAPVLLRRTRDSVMRDLPERTTEIVRIRPTAEQQLMSDEYTKRAAQIAAKAYLTEMDLLRLQKCLLMARMSADSTFLVDKEEPGYSSKLERLTELLEQLLAEEDRKIVLFSEWTTMLGLIEPIFEQMGADFVRLDGKVPQKKRQQLVYRFQNDPNCRAIIMSNAGSTGLNLQAANTVINVDLPWNPAVLEQRIARAHRMGQRRNVQVYLLVTEDTIEERLLGTLSAKHDLALAALDADSEVSEVELHSGMEELKRRLERLLGNERNAPIDVSRKRAVEAETERIAARRDKVAAASGELLGAAVKLLGELIDTGGSRNGDSFHGLDGRFGRLDRGDAGHAVLDRRGANAAFVGSGALAAGRVHDQLADLRRRSCSRSVGMAFLRSS